MNRPGELVLVEFPFTDLRTTKRRPALVLADSGDNDILLARVTTRGHSGGSDLFLIDWHESGLLLPSWVQLAKLVTVEGARVERVLGKLSPQDAVVARDVLLGWLSSSDWL